MFRRKSGAIRKKSDHERQINVVDAAAVVDGTKMAGLGDVEKGVARPEQATDDDMGAAAFMLQTPAEFRCPRNVLSSRIKEVQRPVQVGAL